MRLRSRYDREIVSLALPALGGPSVGGGVDVSSSELPPPQAARLVNRARLKAQAKAVLRLAGWRACMSSPRLLVVKRRRLSCAAGADDTDA